ncbi:Phosphotransferase enzyme family protein [Bhargavaea ginsengi]|uniref:Phosphotransferase enzyme family protein n=1 Tax=Bhargavaea ginsengi TaxID=426757 RepID=A0A1H6X9L8_9BACL|nr:aminoglycoside phosphotransferase family protein [Bhargavaea ginsengi]SEJ24154.1 Phosphotransferase enzyme family protein [Bhargavaea ginsengi]
MAAGGNIRQIKQNVWKWEVGGKRYSLKKYDSAQQARKVRRIHDELQKIGFPYVLPIIGSADERAVIQPWLDRAKSADYSSRAGRERTLSVLRTLHATSGQVNWEGTGVLYPYPLVAKWEDRLAKFRKQKKQLVPLIGNHQYESIVYHAEEALRTIRKTYDPEENCTLLHGDVVHHNFLRATDGNYVMIDFDLACTGPAGTETALWIHRVLPHVDFNLDYLCGEQPELASLSASSFSLLLYPNELLREWLYLLSLDEEKQKLLKVRLDRFTDKALSAWIPLCYQVAKRSNQ